MIEIEKGYFIRKSTRKNKKYDIYHNDKYFLSFGDKRYEQFKDQTPIKAFAKQNHGDPERKRLYFLRHGKTADRKSSKYWSNNYLWK
jgi:hypothetical protein